MSEFMQRDICDGIADILKADSGLNACTVVVWDRADVAAELQKNQTGVTLVVSSTCHTRRRGSGTSLSGEVEINVLCSEVPRVNRAGGRLDFLSAQGAAELVAKALHRAKVEGCTLVYDVMDRQDEGDRDRVVVTLHAEASIDASALLAWGLADGTQAYGEIVKIRTVHAGDAIFENDSKGDARWLGVHDRHLVVDLTADVPAGTTDFPEIGERFTCPVDGVATSFVCTAADLTEDAEDTASLHLAGRTL